MEEKLCSVAELASIVGTHSSRMYTYLGKYGFDEFRTVVKNKNSIKQMYRLNRKLAYRLCDLFDAINRKDCVDRIIEYFESTGM